MQANNFSQRPNVPTSQRPNVPTSQRPNVPTLLLCFLLSLVAFLSGCQKEILSPTQISKQESRTPTIKIDEVKEWYQRAKATFDREKNLRSGSTGLDGVVPDWHFFQNSYNTIGQEFGVAPLNFMVGSKGFARLLINRDSTGNLIGKYAIYLPDSMYRLATHGRYTPQTFTGLILYFNSDGSFSYGNEYINGLKGRDASIIDKNRLNVIPRDCSVFTFTNLVPVQLGALGVDEDPVFREWTLEVYTVTICSGGSNGGSPNTNGSDSGGGGNIDPTDAFLGAGIDGLVGVLDGEVPASNLISRFPNQADFINGFISLNNKLGGQLDRNLIPIFYGNQELLSQFNNYTASEALKAINTLKKGTTAGFTVSQISLLVQTPEVLTLIFDILDDNSLSQQQKNSFFAEIKNYLQSEDFQVLLNANNAPPPQTSPINPDARLEFSALLSNPNFSGCNTQVLRTMINDANSSLPEWQKNISAGLLLEEAFGKFIGVWGQNPPTPNYLRGPNKPFKVNGGLKTIRPDFIHATVFIQMSSGEPSTTLFPDGGVVEVKVPQNAVTLDMSRSQIKTEIKWASEAKNAGCGWGFDCVTAGSKNVGSFLLVLPQGTLIDPAVVTECTSKGVNLYVSYAFLETATQKVVFSNPKNLNNLSNEIYPKPLASFDKKIDLDVNGAIQRWQNSNNDTDD